MNVPGRANSDRFHVDDGVLDESDAMFIVVLEDVGRD